MFIYLCMFGFPPYIWTPPYVWMLPYLWISSYTFGGHLNIWGCPDIQGVYKCMGAYGHLLSLTKHAFSVLYVALVPVTESHSCQRGMCVKLATHFSQLRYLVLYKIFDITENCKGWVTIDVYLHGDSGNSTRWQHYSTLMSVHFCFIVGCWLRKLH